MMMSFSLSTVQARGISSSVKSVRRRKTIIVCGTDASGKTHLCKAALGEVPLLNASSPSRTRRNFAGSHIRTLSISTTTRTGKMGHPRQALWSRLPFACDWQAVSAGDPRRRRRDRLPRRLADRASGRHHDDPRQRLQRGVRPPTGIDQANTGRSGRLRRGHLLAASLLDRCDRPCRTRRKHLHGRRGLVQTMRAVIRTIAVALSAVAAALAAWLVAASYLFAALGRLDIDQRWLAWWLYATDQPDRWTLCLLAISAIIPAFVTCAVLTALWRAIGARLRRPLYGNSAWATDAEMRFGGIRSSRAFF